MRNFYEAKLQAIVDADLAKVYKKAIESENERKWVENPVTVDGVTKVEIKPVWGGCHANVEIKVISDRESALELTLVSRTLPNLKETVKSYELDRFNVLETNY
ncbi:hypothetical protein [Enterococcus mundtii]